MKIFLRTGAFYQAETKSLTDDLDITELFSEKNIVTHLKEETAFEKTISELNKRVDDLTKKLSNVTYVERVLPLPIDDKPVAKPVVKKAVKKK